jgi:hypothetical protein
MHPPNKRGNAQYGKINVKTLTFGGHLVVATRMSNALIRSITHGIISTVCVVVLIKLVKIEI